MSNLREDGFLLVILAFLASSINVGVVAFARETAEISVEFTPLTYSNVVFVTLIAVVAAYSVLAVLKTYTSNYYEYFGYFSGLVLIMSFMPIGHVAADIPEAGIPEINVLGLVHVVTAVVIVMGLFKIEQRKN